MTEFALLYLVFAGFIVVAGLTMIVTYSLSYPWWRNGLGRMVVIYAAAEMSMSAILCLAVVWRINPVWFRAVWFGLQLAVGTTFCVQTATIVRLLRERRRKPGRGSGIMSAEARVLDLIDDAVQRATEPLKAAVEALHARLTAVEGVGGPTDAAPQKRASTPRTAKAKADPAAGAVTAEEPKMGAAE